MGDRRRHIRFQTPTVVNPSRNRAPPHVHSHSGPPAVHRPIPTRTSQATAAASIPLSSLINITGDAIFTNMREDGVAILGVACPSPSTPPPRNRSSRPALPHEIYQQRERTHPPQPSMPILSPRDRITPSHRSIYQPQEEVAVFDELRSGSSGAQVYMPRPLISDLLPHISGTAPFHLRLPPQRPEPSNGSHFDGHHGGVLSNLDEGASYEVLLELGELLGAVRSVSEEDISAHLNVERASSSMESDICVICQDSIQTQQAIAALQCNHTYHAGCIRRWLLEKNVCPVCKRTGIVV